MAPPKRTPFQREESLHRIASLYLQQWTQAEIAREVGLSQGMISNDLKLIQKRWREETAFNLDEAKSMELARLDTLEREYWAAWERSKSERAKKRQETDGKAKDGKPNVKKLSIQMEQRDGNPAFLDGVRNCIADRRKLLGLDAPTKSELTGANGGALTVRIIYDDTDIDPDATQATTLATTGSA